MESEPDINNIPALTTWQQTSIKGKTSSRSQSKSIYCAAEFSFTIGGKPCISSFSHQLNKKRKAGKETVWFFFHLLMSLSDILTDSHHRKHTHIYTLVFKHSFLHTFYFLTLIPFLWLARLSISGMRDVWNSSSLLSLDVSQPVWSVSVMLLRNSLSHLRRVWSTWTVSSFRCRALCVN